ncbi:hypothetical protein E4U32_005476 [Claviceps aff. humidiphila group G2b]|nr:hypothetical protein E4U32_005476 [Claviceps aff. humidiphila group G2b]
MLSQDLRSSGTIRGPSSQSFIDDRSALIAKLQESEANAQRMDEINRLQAKLDAMEAEAKRAQDKAKRAQDEAKRAQDKAKRAQDEAKRAQDEAKRTEDEAKAIVRELSKELYGVKGEDIDDVRTGKLEPWNLILLYPVFEPRPYDGVFTLEIDASNNLFLKRKLPTATDYTDDPMVFFEAFKNYMRIYERFFNEQHPDVVVAQAHFADFIKEKAKYHLWSSCLDYAMRRLRIIKSYKWHDAETWLCHPPNWVATFFDHMTLKPVPSAKKRKRDNSTGNSTARALNHKTVVRDADRPVFHLFTDASNTGIGGFFYCGNTAQSDWRTALPLPREQIFARALYPNERSHHINVTETIAIAAAIKKWANSWRHATLIIHTNNTTAEAGFRHGQARGRPANRSIQSALARCAARDIKIHCNRVTSADNGLADALSRLDWPTVAQLCPNLQVPL